MSFTIETRLVGKSKLNFGFMLRKDVDHKLTALYVITLIALERL